MTDQENSMSPNNWCVDIIDSLNASMLAQHNYATHLIDLNFGKKCAEMDIAESFAAQGLAQANVARDRVAGNTAAGAPLPQGSGLASAPA